jgi:hypothetical protein
MSADMQKSETSDLPTGYTDGTYAPNSFSVEASFDQIRHLLSDRPLRRYVPRLTSEQVARIRDKASQNRPPQAWFDEDLSGLQ